MTALRESEVTKGGRNPKKRLYSGVIRWEPEAVIRYEKLTGLGDTRWSKMLVLASVLDATARIAMA
jgi:hypothetical protein